LTTCHHRSPTIRMNGVCTYSPPLVPPPLLRFCDCGILCALTGYVERAVLKHNCQIENYVRCFRWPLVLRLIRKYNPSGQRLLISGRVLLQSVPWLQMREGRTQRKVSMCSSNKTTSGLRRDVRINTNPTESCLSTTERCLSRFT